jgi:hydrogenase maturation factor
MFVHIGGDITVPKESIIMILDCKASKSLVVKEFLGVAREENSVHLLDQGKERSYVITDRGVFISPISSSTIMKRSASIFK